LGILPLSWLVSRRLVVQRKSDSRLRQHVSGAILPVGMHNSVSAVRLLKVSGMVPVIRLVPRDLYKM
jgi:hypothetical protein